METKSIENPCTDDCIRIVRTILHQCVRSIWGQPECKGRFSAYDGIGVLEERTEAWDGRFVSESTEELDPLDVQRLKATLEGHS